MGLRHSDTTVLRETTLAGIQNRLIYLDTMRGWAALVVVFCHWQFFLSMGTSESTYDVKRMPFYEVLRPLYHNAWMGVDFFFTLSGFVFCLIYAGRISDRQITWQKFTIVRLARLYPLHIATLLLVLIAQLAYSGLRSDFFIFRFNDLKHFLYNLFMVSSWGLEEGYSFNGSFWSVSVEVFLYIIFFLICRIRPMTWRVAVTMTVLGFVLRHVYSPLGRGVSAFFLGCLMCLMYQSLVRRGLSRSLTRRLVFAGIVLWGVFILISYYPPILNLRNFPFVWRIQNAWELLLLVRYPVYVLFPYTILVVAVYETLNPPRRKDSILGDISYSLYMLHFPLQLMLALALVTFEVPHGVFYSIPFMLAFYAVLIAGSIASYRYFEHPARRYIRNRIPG